MKKVIILAVFTLISGCSELIKHANSPLPAGYDKTAPYRAESAFEYGTPEGRWYGGATAKRAY